MKDQKFFTSYFTKDRTALRNRLCERSEAIQKYKLTVGLDTVISDMIHYCHNYEKLNKLPRSDLRHIITISSRIRTNTIHENTVQF